MILPGQDLSKNLSSKVLEGLGTEINLVIDDLEAQYQGLFKDIAIWHRNYEAIPKTPGPKPGMVILHDHVYLYDKAGDARALADQGGMLSEAILWSLPVLAVLFGLLMVSRVEYVHVVNRYLRGRLSFAGVVRGLIVVALTVFYPEVTIPVLSCPRCCSA